MRKSRQLQDRKLAQRRRHLQLQRLKMVREARATWPAQIRRATEAQRAEMANTKRQWMARASRWKSPALEQLAAKMGRL
ncbi:hypothetical protein B5P46_11775 [Rhizobium leguminosarum]|uniref:Uncharacterized protein n=1 Tax=Rhizobium leguminosarum TaxID=384 RepID=A0A4Q1UBJ3_RHILE|nr:hypothetical protein [Rhizobium leguminosarum]RXT29354.1 hypothetical protein B5P46_11775 [Rhizobium leguminosarum]